jgi:hypothetical protein
MTSISNTARGLGGPLDLGVAGLAAISIGFLAFAMPEDLFSSLVSASHIPDLVAAAAPPLGMKARYAVMGGAAAFAFLICWSLLRALDARPSATPKAKPARKEAEPDAPRLRRADAHPDAPSRRPLFAGAELGEPDADVYELDTPEFAADDSFEPAALPVEIPEAQVAEPEIAEPVSRLPRFLVAEAEQEAPTPSPIVEAAQKQKVVGLTVPPSNDGEIRDAASIGALMSRLERGLAERKEPEPVAAVEPDLPPPLVEASVNPDVSLSPEGVRHRLRSAISELNQAASRG